MERIAVVIGHNGETKKHLEDKSEVHLEIDSKLGEIAIDDHNVEDPLRVLKLESIILAIGRGFSPEHAMKLLNDNTDLFIFDIHDYVDIIQTCYIFRIHKRGVYSTNMHSRCVWEE